MSAHHPVPFGDLVRQYRLALELTQDELAERAGISPRGVRALEAGERSTPQRETVRLLAEALGLEGDARTQFEAAARTPGPLAGETLSEQRLATGAFLGSLPPTPLVGREVEQRQIEEIIERARAGEGQLLLLAGEPGAGKTRLGQEATAILQRHGFLLAAGTCQESQRTVPYSPVVEALGMLVGMVPEKIRHDAARRWPYLTRLLPDLDETVAMVAAADTDAQPLLFRAVVAFLQAIAVTRPTALLMDDLHWADGATLALLSFLVRQTRGDRVLLLGTYRDTEVGRGHPLEHVLTDLRRLQLVEEIAVSGLPPDGTSTLIAQTLGRANVTSSLAATVYERTDGNPFFVQELVRALAEQGELDGPDQEIPTMVVPANVRAVLARRIEGLTDTTQQVLRYASVLGQRFRFNELVVLSRRDSETVERALEEAQRIALVREADIDMYAFNHALTQHALLDELSGRRRRRLHGDSGRVLEALPARERERRAAELAWHFWEAEELERALTYTLQAGEYDEQVFAHEEAERHYRRALQLARKQSDQGREIEAREKLGRVLVVKARFDEALEVLERAVELHRTDGDREAEARATVTIAEALGGKGRTVEALARLERMLAAFEGASASPGYAGLYSSLAAHLMYTGRYEDMIATADRAEELARAVGDESMAAVAKYFQGTALTTLGRIDDARRVLKEAVELMERIGAVRPLRRALGNLGETYLILGELEQTRYLWERVLLLAEQVGDPQGLTFWSANLSEISFYLGDWAAARGYAERAAGILEGSDPAWPTAYPPLRLGIVEVAEGYWEEGDRHLAACLAVAEQHEDLQARREAHRWLAERDLMEGRAKEALARLQPLLDRPGLEEEQVARLLPCLALAYLELGDLDRAEETVMMGLERAARQSHGLALVDLLRVEGMLRARQGRRAEAEQAFEGAVSLARSMPYPYAEARALYEWGRMHATKEEPMLVQSRLEEAAAIFQRLGARPYIERTEQALAVLDQRALFDHRVPGG